MKVKILHLLSMCVHLCSADQKVIQKERYKQTDTEFRDRQKGMGFSISAPQCLNVSASCRETVGESGFVLQESFAQKIK